MPAIFSQYGLKQTAPTPKAPREANSRTHIQRAREERELRLRSLWQNPDISADEIARILGYASRNTVYSTARRLKLPFRVKRVRGNW